MSAVSASLPLAGNSEPFLRRLTWGLSCPIAALPSGHALAEPHLIREISEHADLAVLHAASPITPTLLHLAPHSNPLTLPSPSLGTLLPLSDIGLTLRVNSHHQPSPIPVDHDPFEHPPCVSSTSIPGLGRHAVPPLCALTPCPLFSLCMTSIISCPTSPPLRNFHGPLLPSFIIQRLLHNIHLYSLSTS